MKVETFSESVRVDGLVPAFAELDKKISQRLGEDADIKSVTDTLYEKPPGSAKYEPSLLVRVVIYTPKK